ncbi:hypothetical protein L1887_32256 [Cichorium endivia]|nr:hypothetical protein L1887_32256 [Cichorium endivia]
MFHPAGPRVAQPWIGAPSHDNLICRRVDPASNSGKRLCLLSSIRIVLLLANTLQIHSWNSCDLVVFIRPFNTTVVEIASSGVAVKSCTVWAAVRLSGLLAGTGWKMRAGARPHGYCLRLSSGCPAKRLGSMAAGLICSTIWLLVGVGAGQRGYWLKLAAGCHLELATVLLVRAGQRMLAGAGAAHTGWSWTTGLPSGTGAGDCRLELDHGAATWNWQQGCWLALESGGELAGAESRLRARAGPWLPAGQRLSAGSGERGCSLESTAWLLAGAGRHGSLSELENLAVSVNKVRRRENETGLCDSSRRSLSVLAMVIHIELNVLASISNYHPKLALRNWSIMTTGGGAENCKCGFKNCTLLDVYEESLNFERFYLYASRTAALQFLEEVEAGRRTTSVSASDFVPCSSQS